MKIIKTKILIALSFVSLLLLGTSAQAALTSQGSHPELLASAQCSGRVDSHYALFGNRFGIRIKDTAEGGYHPNDIIAKNLGEANIVYIEGHPSAQVNGFGSDGMGFYELDGNRYFVGPYYNTRTNSFEFQICWTPIYTGPTYVGQATEDQNLACPPAQPSGSIVQRRTYDLYSDGSRQNVSAWNTIVNSCVAVKNQTNTVSRVNGCPAGQIGSITQLQTYDVWSDGTTRNYSGWYVSNNTCSFPAYVVNPTQRAELCPEGYTGKISYKWVVYYTDEVYSITDAEGQAIDYIVNTPHQREILDYNSCTMIPTHQTEVTYGPENISCDTYFHAAKGTYIGTVTQTFQYTSTYNSATQKTEKTSVLISQDVSGCTQDPQKVFAYENNTQACPSGQTGLITLIRMKATDNKGAVTYPNGTDWIISNNTCTGLAVVEPVKENTSTPPQGLLANMSRSSSEFTNAKNTNDFVTAMKSLTNVADEDHRLWLIIDDLRPAYYNKANVSKAIQSHNAASKNRGIYQIDTPMSLDKYVGNGKLKDVKNKYIISAKLNSKNEIELVYADSTGKSVLDKATVETLNIPLFDSSVTNLKVK